MSELIYGKNSVVEAIKNSNVKGARKIETCYVTSLNEDVIALLNKNNIKYQIVQKDKIFNLLKNNDLNPNVNHQGVLAMLEDYKYYDLSELVNEKNDSLIVALDGLEDPHNLGAIIRTAEISGVDGIILPKNRSVKVTSTVSKVSTGAIEHVKVSQVTNLVSSLKELKKKGYWIVGAEALEESKDFWHTDLNMKVCLVIGSEGKGISRLVKEECDILVKIPMWGKVNSLNASVSAALIIYEIRRQQNINK